MGNDYYSLDEIKQKFESYRNEIGSNITDGEYVKFCDEINLLPKETVNKIFKEIYFVLMGASSEKKNPACYINLKHGIDKEKEGIIVLAPDIFRPPFTDQFNLTLPILHEVAHHEMGHYNANNQAEYDKNEKSAQEQVEKWWKQWKKAHGKSATQGT